MHGKKSIKKIYAAKQYNIYEAEEKNGKKTGRKMKAAVKKYLKKKPVLYRFILSLECFFFPSVFCIMFEDDDVSACQGKSADLMSRRNTTTFR